MKHHSRNCSKLSERQKRATILHNLALFLKSEAQVATASGYTHLKNQEVFLKQQFQASSSEKTLLSETVQDFFWVFFGGEKKKLQKIKYAIQRGK